MPEIKVANQDTLLDVKSGVDELLERPVPAGGFHFVHEVPQMPENAMGWMALPITPENFGYASAVSNSDGLYLFGTSSTTSVKTYRYLFASGTWEPLADCPVSLYNSRAVYAKNSMYVLSGFSSLNTKFHKFSPISNSWTALTDAPSPSTGAAIGVLGGSIYVAGGFGSVSQTSLRSWYPDYSWSTTSAQLPQPASSAMGGVIGDEFYVLAADSSKVFMKYQMYGDKWVMLTSPPVVLLSCAHAVVGKKIIFAGGETQDTQNYRHVWVYDSVTDSWERTTDTLRQFVMSGVGVAYNDMFFALGASNPVPKAFDVMKPKGQILGSQIVGEVRQGQSIFYQVYGGDAALWLNNNALPQGISIAAADGNLISQFTSGFGVLRGWVN